MNRRLCGFFTMMALILSVASSTNGAVPWTFRVDTRKSRLEASTTKAGMLSRFGHAHEIQAREFTGSVRVVPDRLEDSSIRIEVGAAALEVAAGELGKQDQAKVQANMVGDQILDVAKFPTITFESTKLIPIPGDGNVRRFRVEGKVGLHGVTREMVLPVEVRFDEKIFEGRGEFTLLQTDFDIKPFSALLGSVKVGDEVKVRYSIHADRSAD